MTQGQPAGEGNQPGWGQPQGPRDAHCKTPSQGNQDSVGLSSSGPHTRSQTGHLGCFFLATSKLRPRLQSSLPIVQIFSVVFYFNCSRLKIRHYFLSHYGAILRLIWSCLLASPFIFHCEAGSRKRKQPESRQAESWPDRNGHSTFHWETKKHKGKNQSKHIGFKGQMSLNLVPWKTGLPAYVQNIRRLFLKQIHTYKATLH